MIVTLTPNPAVDQTVMVEHLAIGSVNRFSKSHLDPAGKGVNVSRMAHRLGWPTIAFGFLAGEIGQLVEVALEAEGVEHHFVHMPGQTRINITLVERAERVATSLYGPGPAIDDAHRARLDNLFFAWTRAARLLVLAGSLPPGMPHDAYATYIRHARSMGVPTVLDADGEALRLGVAARPYLIKPNIEEAERLLGRSLPDLDAVIEAATELEARGVDIVVISMGADGAVCAADGKVFRAVPPTVEVRSTVGSGDSFVAGMAVSICREESITDALRLATAAGAATAAALGTALGAADSITELLPQVVVEEVH